MYLMALNNDSFHNIKYTKIKLYTLYVEFNFVVMICCVLHATEHNVWRSFNRVSLKKKCKECVHLLLPYDVQSEWPDKSIQWIKSKAHSCFLHVPTCNETYLVWFVDFVCFFSSQVKPAGSLDVSNYCIKVLSLLKTRFLQCVFFFMVRLYQHHVA